MERSEAEGMPWVCATRAQGTAGGNDLADCDWPMCGCDPYANKVVAALNEQGLIVPNDPAITEDRVREIAREVVTDMTGAV